TYLEPNRNSLQKPIEGRSRRLPKHSLQKRISNLTEKFDGDTQHVRAQLIMELKGLQETAIDQVQSKKGPKDTEQQVWMKLAAYISQVINSISKTYDVTQIKTELEQLRKTIGELEKQ
ncbi:MAG: hypothetical protein ACE14S_00650, partial [Candidatus Bathyarchaeia archaeon]